MKKKISPKKSKLIMLFSEMLKFFSNSSPKIRKYFKKINVENPPHPKSFFHRPNFREGKKC